MNWHLDTNTCIYFLKGKSEVLAQHFRSKAPAELQISALVSGELLLGAEKSEHRRQVLPKVQAFLEFFEIMPFDHATAGIYAKLRADLEQKGQVIGPNDMIIAATALANHATLVTHNLKEFKRVKGLKVEDWLE